MFTLREIKDKLYHYYNDSQGRVQGEYKEWFFDGRVYRHCFYKDGELHGEYKKWYGNRGIYRRYFYQNDEDITSNVKALVEDIENITDEERMMIKLKFGIECLC